MVIRPHSFRQRGALMVELLVAMALLTGAVLPLAYSFAAEKRLARASYQRAVAMEVVDGEIEVLAAGEWRAFSLGAHDYSAHNVSATNLPPGRFLLTLATNKVRLEWQPSIKMHGGGVVREAMVR
jgi:Tfp pilus assembly protein PilX